MVCSFHSNFLTYLIEEFDAVGFVSREESDTTVFEASPLDFLVAVWIFTLVTSYE